MPSDFNLDETQVINTEEVVEEKEKREVRLQKEYRNESFHENNIDRTTTDAKVFLGKETSNLKMIMIVTSLIMFVPFVCSWIYIILKTNQGAEWYFYLIPAIIILVTSIISFFSIKNFLRVRKDYRQMDSNAFHQSVPISVVRMYKNLHTSIININWFSFSAYLYGGITILVFHLLGGMDEDKVGKWDYLRYSDIKYTYFIICGTVLFLAVNHAFQFIMKNKKINEITTIFGSNVLSYGELTIIKKMTRRRNMWLTVFIFILLTYGPVWLIKKLFKK